MLDDLPTPRANQKGIKAALRAFQQRDIKWADERLSRTPLYSGYWVKKRIDEAIKANASRAHGMLLDIGCGLKPYKGIFEPYVEKHLGLEYLPESGYRGNNADFCGDAAMLPLADASVDTILCTEVMEHLSDPERTIGEFARVLRPGGRVITTAPFVFPIHDAHDFFRYSPDGLAAMMRRHGLMIEKVEPLSGTAVTLATMINLYWFDIGFMWTKWMYPVGLAIRPLLWLMCFTVNITGAIFEKILPSSHMAFNHITIASKK